MRRGVFLVIPALKLAVDLDSTPDVIRLPPPVANTRATGRIWVCG